MKTYMSLDLDPQMAEPGSAKKAGSLSAHNESGFEKLT
jgi:hypothetical protein